MHRADKVVINDVSGDICTLRAVRAQGGSSSWSPLRRGLPFPPAALSTAPTQSGGRGIADHRGGEGVAGNRGGAPECSVARDPGMTTEGEWTP